MFYLETNIKLGVLFSVQKSTDYISLIKHYYFSATYDNYNH